ncbi:L-aspartate oxidase [Acaryochloris thomasi RCC1774]|uniref:L-aspartate oxidase n=1 Tax=Acaryochloris thomasi RCC1774 TaxID=1764569 RepID=A0A2W1JP75_9CYAN|nr:L-aspartate oxidase [Acaryochloris thomasi RCC1774]
MYTALSLPPSLRVALVTKDNLTFSASDWAQGGIAAAFQSDDSPQLHAQDTLLAGAGLCDRAAVDFLVEEAPAQVEALLEMGIAFDRRQDNQLAATLEAAHSRARVLHAADTTGRALIKTLTAQVWARDNIRVLTETFTLSLWLHPLTQVCQGCCLLAQGRIDWVRADAVVLATGGGGQVFSQTTNPVLSTGDGLAIASRSGAQIRDLEFFQFHPTALTVPGAPRFLISEAVRGEGAYLTDAENRRFMFDYDPRGELAPRDIVSRSIFMHLKERPEESVSLDLRDIPSEKIQRRFPKIIEVCQQWGINVFEQPIPVSPAAHYWMGGITTKLDAQTTIPGLYSVGEVASTGVHGANRLASNSLLECLVFGAQFSCLNVSPTGSESPLPQVTESLETDWEAQAPLIMDLRQQLPTLVWDSAGICRTEAVMKDAIAKIKTWRQPFERLPLSQAIHDLPPGQSVSVSLADAELRLWAETENLLDIADLILRSALFRTESRGGHYRLDYPETVDKWQVHTLVQNGDWKHSEKIKI